MIMYTSNEIILFYTHNVVLVKLKLNVTFKIIFY